MASWAHSWSDHDLTECTEEHSSADTSLNDCIHGTCIDTGVYDHALIIYMGLYERYESLFVSHTFHVTGDEVMMCGHLELGRLVIWLLESMEHTGKTWMIL